MPLPDTGPERSRAAFVPTDATQGDGAPAQRVVIAGAVAGGIFPAAAAKGDALATPTVSEIGALLQAFNGTTWDRWRNNSEGSLLASAARTATTNSADQVNYNARGVRVTFNMTSVPAVETVTLSIQEKDPVSGTYTAMLTGLAVVATGLAVYVVYPGSLVAANVSASTPLPRTWRVAMTHSASGSFTYSVAFALIV